MPREKSSRKYQLTINNPLQYGYTHEQIKNNLNSLTLVYWCLCDEVGAEQTPHTHIFLYAKNPIMFSTIKKRFYESHIEVAHGTCQENRDYIRKEGKYLNSDKKETNLIDTFEEYGEMPIEKKGSSDSVSSQVLQMIKDGCKNTEIIDAFPSYLTKSVHIEKVRQEYLEEKYANEFRNLDITYIYGETETGKTRSVLETYGYSNVYKVTNYQHPFDSYKNQDVILFDEFRSSLPLTDMLQYLDGYPCMLPSRYADKQACYTKVYLISNIPLSEQYRNMKREEKESWNAFIRRIKHIYCYSRKDKAFSGYDINNIDITELFE